MDPATLGMLNVGFALAGKVLNYVGTAHPERTSAAPPIDDAVSRTDFLEHLESSAARVESAISEGVRAIIDKIEMDRLEELRIRTKILTQLLVMQRPDTVLVYALQLRESVHYAENRLREDKLKWLGPYLLGYSIFVAALSLTGERSSVEFDEFRTAVRRAKTDLLDQAIPRLLRDGQQIPWLDVVAFISEGSDSLVPLLLRSVDTGPPAQARQMPTPGQIEYERVCAIAQRTFRGVDRAYVTPSIPQSQIMVASRMLLTTAGPNEPLIALLGGNEYGVALFPTSMLYCDYRTLPLRLQYQDPASRGFAKGNEVYAYGRTLALYNAALAKALVSFLAQVNGQQIR
ncbi:MAG TPA: hypothetical protein VFJ82_00625 [Longimicrobium sp.]|nr:hypothetical protein [Longimicrobium sp.]